MTLTVGGERHADEHSGANSSRTARCTRDLTATAHSHIMWECAVAIRLVPNGSVQEEMLPMSADDEERLFFSDPSAFVL